MARPAVSIGNPIRPQSIILSLLGGAALTAFPPVNGAKFLMPQTGEIIGVTVNVGSKGGTHSVSTLDLQTNAGATMLASLLDIAALTAGTPVSKEGAALAAAAASVAKDTVMKLVWNQSGGTSPTWTDVTVQIDYIPLGD